MFRETERESVSIFFLGSIDPSFWTVDTLATGFWIVGGGRSNASIKRNGKIPQTTKHGKSTPSPPHTHTHTRFLLFLLLWGKNARRKGQNRNKDSRRGMYQKKAKKKEMWGVIVFQHKSWAQPFFHILFEELSQTTSLPPPNSWKNSTTLASLHELSDRQRDSRIAFFMIPTYK
jgi:hypothetical protein